MLSHLDHSGGRKVIFSLNVRRVSSSWEGKPIWLSKNSYPPGRRFPFSESESEVVELPGLLELLDPFPSKGRQRKGCVKDAETRCTNFEPHG